MEKILEAPMSIRVSNQVVDGQIISDDWFVLFLKNKLNKIKFYVK